MTEAKFGNYSSCCRLCLTDKYNSLNSIYAGYPDGEVLVEKIHALIGVQITINDKLSTMLCQKCFITVSNWDGYKKKCVSNQAKLQQWMEGWCESVANTSCQIKEEPVEEVIDNDIISIEEDENLLVKSEPIESMDVEDEYLDLPPPLTPHPPEPQSRNEINIEMTDNTSPKANYGLETYNSSKNCSRCDKSFSTPGNRRKHEKFMHGLYGGYNSKKYKPPVVNGDANDEALQPPALVKNDMSFIPNGVATEKEQEKIEFAAGLCLQSKSATPTKITELTKIENQYLEKCRVIITMMKKSVCSCHNQYYNGVKKMFGHLRSLFAWFPPYTCYNCMVVYDGRSAKMRHAMRCPRLDIESLIRLSELRSRSDDKIRLYQNFKCIQCNYLFSFYEDYCEHVDNEHVVDEGPFACLCLQEFGNPDSFRAHIHKSCYLNYYCDICFLLSPNLDEFRQHCEESHDLDEHFQFLPVHPKFTIMNNLQIANLLFGTKELQEAEDTETEAEISTIETTMDSIEEEEDSQDETKSYGSPKVGQTKCTHCDKRYSSYHNMLRHLKQFHNIEPLNKQHKSSCPICGNKFSNYYNMLRHCKTHDEEMKKINCPKCPEKFRLSVELKEHLHAIHLIKQSVRIMIRCEECGESFKNNQMLEVHQREEHLFTCNECGKTFYKSIDFEQHRNTHLNITLTRDPKTQNYRMLGSNNQCEICDESFATDTDLQQHVILHEDMPNLEEEEDTKDFKKYKCRECNKEYTGSRGLWVHNKRYHPDRTSNKDFPKDCDECSRTISTLAGWIMHKQMHVRANQKSFSVGKLREAKETDDSDYHTCKRCFKVFSSKYNLRTHMKSHGIHLSPSRAYHKSNKFVKTFWCDICHQACQGLADLNKHKLEHLNEDAPELENQLDLDAKRNVPKKIIYKTEPEDDHGRQVYCKYCKIAFDTLDELNVHMEEEHDENLFEEDKESKVFPCDICKKIFKTASSLIAHQGWHKRTKANRPWHAPKVEEKIYKKVINSVKYVPKFKCISCAATFEDDTSLQLHILEVHRNINATLSFKCSICRLDFPTQAEHDAHERLHFKQKENKTGVLCKYCKKTFSRSDYLNIHISKKHPEHAIVGTHKCNQCDRVFEKQNALTIHLKVHERVSSGGTSTPGGTKVYKYYCSICHVGFDIPKDLRNHIISNHPF